MENGLKISGRKFLESGNISENWGAAPISKCLYRGPWGGTVYLHSAADAYSVFVIYCTYIQYCIKGQYADMTIWYASCFALASSLPGIVLAYVCLVPVWITYRDLSTDYLDLSTCPQKGHNRRRSPERADQ